jgi:hypothetical protein
MEHAFHAEILAQEGLVWKGNVTTLPDHLKTPRQLQARHTVALQ